MENISTIGLDIAQSVVRVRAIGEAGDVVVRRRLKRRQLLQFLAMLKLCFLHGGLRQ
jgi:transposase